ncbi:exo-alpha-sialidase [bacterium]|nr:exo-alpha-sialidase [bacterium]
MRGLPDWRAARLLALLVAVAGLVTGASCSCGNDGDDGGAAAVEDAADDDSAVDDDESATDDDDASDDDADDDDADDDAAGDDDTETFPPEEQTPFLERGFILPPDSLECTPEDTGVPQPNCNHHGSTVAELPDGTMAAVWYHGVAEKSPDSRIVWSTLAPGETGWTWPEVLFDDPGLSEGNPALWVSESGELLVFFVTITGNGWDQSAIRLIRSDDLDATWGAPVGLREEYCWMARHRPLRLENGELLLPLYSECLAYPTFMRSTDDFATWTEESHLSIPFLLQHLGQIQPSLINLPGGRIAAITRDGFPTHRVKRMVSDDFGQTWTPSRITELPNAGTSVDWVRLLDGHEVVVYNDSPTDRFPLSVALSHDGGETFVAKRDLIDTDDECDGDCQYHYPSIAQSTHDGTIWITYTHDRRTIGWVRFNEAWLLE